MDTMVGFALILSAAMGVGAVGGYSLIRFYEWMKDG